MKNISKTVYILILAIMLNSGCGSGPDSKTIKLTQEDSIRIAKELASAAPIIHPEHLVLVSMANIAYSVKDNHEITGFKFINSNKMVLNLDDFEKYINTNALDGVRLYPGLDDENNLVLILCKADSLNTQEEDYVLINKEFPSPGSLVTTDLENAKNRHFDYFEKVLIFYTAQHDPDSPIFNKSSYSRFYRNEEIQQYILQNTEEITTPHTELAVRFEFGYVPDEFAGEFLKRLNDNTVTIEQMRGFTSMINLVDAKSADMVNPAARYERGNYKGRYLEVGHPCPPRCGVLHPGN